MRLRNRKVFGLFDCRGCSQSHFEVSSDLALGPVFLHFFVIMMDCKKCILIYLCNSLFFFDQYNRLVFLVVNICAMINDQFMLQLKPIRQTLAKLLCHTVLKNSSALQWHNTNIDNNRFFCQIKSVECVAQNPKSLECLCVQPQRTTSLQPKALILQLENCCKIVTPPWF